MTTTAVEPRTVRAGLRYRPALDGLRALAVYLVVAFHAELPGFAGGYIGVDVFFVLSGFLVTKLLLRDIGTGRSIRFAQFYARRFRRLLPAAFVALIVTALAYSALASLSQALDVVGGFRAAFLYVANWYFIHQSTDYFAANVNSNPVLHFWSLAVEEQFYLVWPLLLAGLVALARRARGHQWNVVRVVVGAAIVLSALVAYRTSHVNLARAYYGTDMRAYELLAGGFLALTPQLMRRLRSLGRPATGVLAATGLLAVLALGTSVLSIGPIARGIAVTVATCALIAATEAHNTGAATRVLSSSRAVRLGRISYGTYLWHWPFIVLVSLRFAPSGVVMFVLTCVAATALAAVSFHVIERPVRQSRRLDVNRRRVIVVGLAVSIVSGVVIAPAILRHSPLTAPGAVSASEIDAAKHGKYGVPNCFNKPVTSCVVVPGVGQRMLLVGDSHAQVLIPALARVARDRGLTLGVASLPNCPWPEGIVANPPLAPKDLDARCHENQHDWYDRVLMQYDPDIVLLIHLPVDQTRRGQGIRDEHGRPLSPGDADFDSTISAAAGRTLARVEKPGRKVVVVEPIPLPPLGFDPLVCISQALDPATCRFRAPTAPTPLERYYRSRADGVHTWSLDIDRIICPRFPVCDELVNGTVVRRDPQHITAQFSEQIGKALETQLVRARILS